MPSKASYRRNKENHASDKKKQADGDEDDRGLNHDKEKRGYLARRGKREGQNSKGGKNERNLIGREGGKA